ncbi:MAG: hypothetical protein WDA20_11545 [Desulfuromonadales bacterium]
MLSLFWILVVIGIVYLVRAASTREKVAIGENGEPILKGYKCRWRPRKKDE